MPTASEIRNTARGLYLAGFKFPRLAGLSRAERIHRAVRNAARILAQREADARAEAALAARLAAEPAEVRELRLSIATMDAAERTTDAERSALRAAQNRLAEMLAGRAA